MRLSTDGQVSTFRQPSYKPNGLTFDSEWRLAVCEGGDRESVPPRVTRTNMQTGEVEAFADQYEGKRPHSPNDVTIEVDVAHVFTRRAADATPTQMR
jgi:gluconolactonase